MPQRPGKMGAFPCGFVLAALVALVLLYASRHHVRATGGRSTLVPVLTRNPSVCVLILSAGSHSAPAGPASARWASEKAVWRRYMNCHPDVFCKFIECGASQDADTVSCPCVESSPKDHTLWLKTCLAMQLVGASAYDYVVRPNLNTLVIFDYLLAFLKSFPYDPTLHTGGKTYGDRYVSGSSMIFGRACVQAMESPAFLRNEGFDSDDVCLSAFLTAAGFPLHAQDPPLWYLWNEFKTREANMSTVFWYRHPFVRTKEIKDQAEVQHELVDRFYSNSAPRSPSC